MSKNVTELKPKQEAAIAALLSNRSVDDAASAVKVTPKTLYRWLKEPAFDAAYREARRAAFGQTIARLQQGSPAAAALLLKIVVDASAPPSTRVRAAEIVLDKAAKAIELEDVEARVAELERAAEEQKKMR
jgi:hypothetical protein